MMINSALEDFPYGFYPKRHQTPSEGHLCVPICIYIVLETMRQTIKGIPKLTVDRISKIIGTEGDGTPLGYNIEKINDELIHTIPSLEFKIDYLVSKWEIICNDINMQAPFKRPVIMAIMQYDTHQTDFVKHTVVLLKADNANVVYFDPIYGEMFEPTNKFYNQWLYMDRFCIRLKIGERAQRIIEEFVEKER